MDRKIVCDSAINIQGYTNRIINDCHTLNKNINDLCKMRKNGTNFNSHSTVFGIEIYAEDIIAKKINGIDAYIADIEKYLQYIKDNRDNFLEEESALFVDFDEIKEAKPEYE